MNYGLRMAAWVDRERGVVYCAIRNGMKESVRYCDYLVGNFEFVSVYARRSSTEPWRRIPRRRYDTDGYLSAGPLPWNVRWLKGGQLMPPGPFGTPRAYAYRPALQYTFKVDLAGYIFPPDWTGEVEARITQAMYNTVLDEESAGDRTVESAALALTLPIPPAASSEH